METFENLLLDALGHIHDPAWEPCPRLCEILGYPVSGCAMEVQDHLIENIAAMAPSEELPPGAYARRVFDLLESRYILGLCQEETAYRLHVSRSTVQRLQREAVHALARVLLDQPAGVEAAKSQPHDDWKTQARREIASCRTQMPPSYSDVGSVIQGVVAVEQVAAEQRGVTVRIGHVQVGLEAAIHPTFLRQALITAIGQLTTSGCNSVTLFAGVEEGHVQITLVGHVGCNQVLEAKCTEEGILLTEDMSAKVEVDGRHVFLYIMAPAVAQATILVLDDNPEIADFYRRVVAGTPYVISHLTEGQHLMETVKTLRPSAVVLDVMLPGIDGWELLMRLHEDRATRDIPVVVCSVVREQDLALSLGAFAYLPKPVQPKELRAALKRAIGSISRPTED